MPAGRIVRVHSGIKRDLAVIRPEDLAGADYHAFTGDRRLRLEQQGDCVRPPNLLRSLTGHLRHSSDERLLENGARRLVD